MNTALLQKMLLGSDYSKFFVKTTIVNRFFRNLEAEFSRMLDDIFSFGSGIMDFIFKYATGENFAKNPVIQHLFKELKFLVPVAITFSILYLGWLLLFNESAKAKGWSIEKIAQNLIVAVAISVIGLNVFTQLNNITIKGYKVLNINENTSTYGELVKSNTYDLGYLCENIKSDGTISKKALKQKNTLPSDYCRQIDETEIIEKPSELVKHTKGAELSDVHDVLKSKPFWINGEYTFVKLSNGFLSSGEHYYRYKISWIFIILSQLCITFVAIFLAISVIDNIKEALIAFGVLPAIAFADINDGEKMKKSIGHIFYSYLTILMSLLTYKIYTILVISVPTSSPALGKLTLIFALSFVTIKGSSFVERVLTGTPPAAGQMLSQLGSTAFALNSMTTLGGKVLSTATAPAKAIGGKIGGDISSKLKDLKDGKGDNSDKLNTAGFKNDTALDKDGLNKDNQANDNIDDGLANGLNDDDFQSDMGDGLNSFDLGKEIEDSLSDGFNSSSLNDNLDLSTESNNLSTGSSITNSSYGGGTNFNYDSSNDDSFSMSLKNESLDDFINVKKGDKND